MSVSLHFLSFFFFFLEGRFLCKSKTSDVELRLDCYQMQISSPLLIGLPEAPYVKEVTNLLP